MGAFKSLSRKIYVRSQLLLSTCRFPQHRATNNGWVWVVLDRPNYLPPGVYAKVRDSLIDSWFQNVLTKDWSLEPYNIHWTVYLFIRFPYCSVKHFLWISIISRCKLKMRAMYCFSVRHDLWDSHFQTHYKNCHCWLSDKISVILQWRLSYKKLLLFFFNFLALKFQAPYNRQCKNKFAMKIFQTL